ncbi:hypothetical protein KQI65_11965 [bacterium]|nr:hypothetical protein [bacterium]
MKRLLVIVLLLLSYNASHAQESGDDDFSIVLTAGGGLAHYLHAVDIEGDVRKYGAAGHLRLMWHPDHRLRMGVETGWTFFYHYDISEVDTPFGPTSAALTLTAVPVLLVFSMPVHEAVTLYAGTGGYIVRSHATSFDNTVNVTSFSQGWMAAGSWELGKLGGIAIESELTWYGATEFDDAAVILQMQASLPILRW